ncbi:MAG: hypothetical protein ACYDCK_01420 [Thermoplasmatota archaeon]
MTTLTTNDKEYARRAACRGCSFTGPTHTGTAKDSAEAAWVDLKAHKQATGHHGRIDDVPREGA